VSGIITEILLTFISLLPELFFSEIRLTKSKAKFPGESKRVTQFLKPGISKFLSFQKSNIGLPKASNVESKSDGALIQISRFVIDERILIVSVITGIGSGTAIKITFVTPSGSLGFNAFWILTLLLSSSPA